MVKKNNENSSNKKPTYKCKFKEGDIVIHKDTEIQGYIYGIVWGWAEKKYCLSMVDDKDNEYIGREEDFEKVKKKSLSSEYKTLEKKEIKRRAEVSFMYFGGMIDTAQSKKRISVANLAQKAEVRESELKLFLDGDVSKLKLIEFFRLLEILELKIDIFREI